MGEFIAKLIVTAACVLVINHHVYLELWEGAAIGAGLMMLFV